MLVVARRRLAVIAALLVGVALLVMIGPGLGSVRARLGHASGGWIAAAVALETLSALCYVVIFRAVFGGRLSRQTSYRIAMAEQAANSVLSVSGAGGLAFGAWALRRVGMSGERIARRTVAFFLLTSLANVGAVIVFAALYALGVLSGDPNPALTYGFGAAAVAAILVVLALARLLARDEDPSPAPGPGRLRAAARFVRCSLGQGAGDGLRLLRRRPIGVLTGSLGTMACDLAVLGVAFRAFGHSPALGVLVLGYLVGQLGGNLPLPGGIGGVDSGLIGTFALYHEPLAITTAAVLVYHAVSLWVPAALGSVAFARLRDTLARPRELAREPYVPAGEPHATAGEPHVTGSCWASGVAPAMSAA